MNPASGKPVPKPATKAEVLRTEIQFIERKRGRIEDTLKARRAALNRLEAQLAMSEVGAPRSRHE